ncbi:palmitoyltransferase ZDHHC20-B [Rhipicephalus microplus]|uniref:palmitoyltransferase ZDHHC20-B n=1 Tax=Rhipicephalus microplus TaxID=6941 RepID=UPI003F6D6670
MLAVFGRSLWATRPGRRRGLRRSRSCKSYLLNWLPVVLVCGLFAWAYYAYVMLFCASMIHDSALKATIFGGGFHLLLFLCLWSYVQTTAASIAPVPPLYRLTTGEQQALENCQNERTRRRLLDGMASERGVLTLGTDGCVRFCEDCCLIKPDRCHHCSICRRCIPKMDHHCPWFNNCVCFNTYKFFLLTLFYAVVLSIFGVSTMGKHVIDMWLKAHMTSTTFQLTFLAVVGTSVVLVLGAFLWHHACMVFRNETTLEQMRAVIFREPDDSFDVGYRQNFVQVFGKRMWLWMLPVFTSVGDGVRFPTKLHPLPGTLQHERSVEATYSTGSTVDIRSIASVAGIL